MMRKKQAAAGGILSATISQLVKDGVPSSNQPAQPMPDAYGLANSMKWFDVTDAEINGALAAVIHGHDAEAALKLVGYFYERIQNNEPFNERVLLEYLDHAFGLIVKGKSADVAFGFTRGKGDRDQEDTMIRDMVVAAHFILQRRQGKSYEGAIQDAAELFWPEGKGHRAVAVAVSNYQTVLRFKPDQELRELVDLARTGNDN